jgi:hypothetical protein
MLGLIGCIFGIAGALTVGIVFVPLGLLATVFAFIRGELLTGLLSLLANAVAVIVSPSLWLVAVGLFAAK